jgi:hypothetical protein
MQAADLAMLIVIENLPAGTLWMPDNKDRRLAPL